MWTQPQHFAAWYGPTGATIGPVRFDLRPDHGIPADSPGATGWHMALDKLEAALTRG